MSGELHASAKTLLLQDSRYLRDAMSGRLRAAAGNGTGPAPLVAALGGGAPLPAGLNGPPAGSRAWAAGAGSTATAMPPASRVRPAAS
ncbi:hypothetical protein WJ972_20430 [Achromobacter insuavis]